MKHKHVITGAVLALLLIMITQAMLSSRQQSPSWDEGNHIYAGYMNWKQGLYFMNPEHPPLVKLVATLPLVPLDLKVPPREGRYFKVESWLGGRELLFRNAPEYGGKYSADTLLFRLHMAAFLFGLTLAVLLFVAGREMFGATAGLITLALFVFDPSILAHAPFVTTDTGAACGYFAAVYMFYRFARTLSWQRALACGVVAGLALTTKHSVVVLPFLFALLAMVELALRWKESKQFPSGDLRRLLAGMGVIAAVAYVVLWGMYSFRFAMLPSGVAMPSLQESVTPLSLPVRTFLLFCARYHLLPESYLFGLSDAQGSGLYWPMYFFGRIYTHGRWFYFPVILTLKWTAGTLGVLALAAWTIVSGKVRRAREILFVAVPMFFILGIAMAGPLNMGIRHILPVVPFAFLLCGAGAAWLVKQRRAWAYVVILLLALHAAESLRAYPHYVSFGNMLYGGPSRTHLYFSDSASDWGQQLKSAKQWIEQNNVKECYFAYFVSPFLQPSDYGIPCKPLPTPDDPEHLAPVSVHGTVLVSYGDLNGYETGSWVRNPYLNLYQRKPDHVIANSIAVFEGEVDLRRTSAFGYVNQAERQLKHDPQAALNSARTAVQLVPDGFDENRALGAALAATGDKAGARAAYMLALRRVADMEPSAQAEWLPKVQKKLAELGTN